MSGSANTGKSESSSGASFDQNVWAPQGEALQGLYNNIGSLFGNTLSDIQGNNTNAQETVNQAVSSSIPAWQNMLGGGVYQNMDLPGDLSRSLNQSLMNPSATQEINNMIMGGSGNNYADAMRQQYIKDATDAQNNMLANLDARAAASGMSGGSRHGVATAMGMEDINDALQGNLARVGYETFDKDLDRKLAIAGQADANTLARQNLLSNMLGQQQNTMNQGLGFGSQIQNLGMGTYAPYMMPWQVAGNYANIIGAPTVLSSGRMSGGSDSKGGGVSGGIL